MRSPVPCPKPARRLPLFPGRPPSPHQEAFVGSGSSPLFRCAMRYTPTCPRSFSWPWPLSLIGARLRFQSKRFARLNRIRRPSFGLLTIRTSWLKSRPYPTRPTASDSPPKQMTRIMTNGTKHSSTSPRQSEFARAFHFWSPTLVPIPLVPMTTH